MVFIVDFCIRHICVDVVCVFFQECKLFLNTVQALNTYLLTLVENIFFGGGVSKVTNL